MLYYRDRIDDWDQLLRSIDLSDTDSKPSFIEIILISNLDPLLDAKIFVSFKPVTNGTMIVRISSVLVNRLLFPNMEFGMSFEKAVTPCFAHSWRGVIGLGVRMILSQDIIRTTGHHWKAAEVPI